MKQNPAHRFIHRKAGMTITELAVIILVLLSLISILLVSARGWKRGSDRACCIINVRNCQQAIRAYANVTQLAPGAAIPNGGTRGSVVMDYVLKSPVCPGGGKYDGIELTTIPPEGVVLMECSFGDGTENHLPPSHQEW